MFKSKAIALIALLLLLVGVIGAAVTFPNSNLKEFLLSQQQTNKFTKKFHQEKNISEKNFSSINLDCDSVNVEVVSTASGPINVELNGKYRDDKAPEIKTEISNDTLYIRLKSKQNWFNFDFSNWSRDLTLKVSIPVSIDGKNLTIRNDSGNVNMSNLDMSNIDVEVDSGNVDLRSIVASNLKVDSDSSNIDLFRIDAALIESNVDSGNLKMENVDGVLKASVDSGNINLNTDTLDREIDFNVDSGNVYIRSKEKPSDAQIRFRIDSGSAIIFGQTYQNQEEWVTIGNGKNLVKLSLDSGSLSIQ